MYGLPSAVVLAMGLTLSACDGTLGGFSTSSSEVYTEPGYYGPSPYAEPGYTVPYNYQPDYSGPYGYTPDWGRRDGWHEHEWRERRERAF